MRLRIRTLALLVLLVRLCLLCLCLLPVPGPPVPPCPAPRTTDGPGGAVLSLTPGSGLADLALPTRKWGVGEERGGMGGWGGTG